MCNDKLLIQFLFFVSLYTSVILYQYCTVCEIMLKMSFYMLTMIKVTKTYYLLSADAVTFYK